MKFDAYWEQMDAGFPDHILRRDTAESAIDGVEGPVVGLKASRYDGCKSSQAFALESEGVLMITHPKRWQQSSRRQQQVRRTKLGDGGEARAS